MRFFTQPKFFMLSVLVFLLNANEMRAQIKIGETMVDTTTLIGGLDTPWEILWGPDNYLWITERYGRVSRIDPLSGTLTEILTIADVYEDQEAGLLGMALHRDFENKPLVFLVYTYREESRTKEKLVQYSYHNGLLDSPVILLEDIQGASFHIGSRIAIDTNNCIFLTTGDATETSLAQDPGSLSGKILKMKIDGSIPPDNPDPGSYVWSLGHRNPQGLVISPSGKIYSSEHGPDSDDELNIIRRGGNYGWPVVEGYCDNESEIGFCDTNNVRQPILAWTPTLAVAGIDYYTSDAIPFWHNSILMACLKAQKLVAVHLDEEGNTALNESSFFQNAFGRLRDVCISPDGVVYLAVSNKDGRGIPKNVDDRIIQIGKAEGQGLFSPSHDNKLLIYPNPSSGNKFSLNIPDIANSLWELCIYDGSGRQILTKQIRFEGKDFEFEHKFAPGFYIVSLKNPEKVYNSILINYPEPE